MTADRPPLAEGVPDRLYGRRRSHPLRARQQQLLDETLPRLRLDAAQAADPRAAFGTPVEALWLEVGFGGGEHALAHVERNPRVGYIASEVFENGLCSLLSRLVEEGEEATGALPPQSPPLAAGCAAPAGAAAGGLARPAVPDVPGSLAEGAACQAALRASRRCCRWWRARCGRAGNGASPRDDPTYQAWVAEVMAGQALFDVPPPAEARPAGWPPTRYEAKALREGRRPLYWSLTRRAG